MKTIYEIVCDMLRVADSAEKKHIYDLRELSSDSLRAYANLIKEAHKKELAYAVAAKCEVCDQVAVAKSATTTPTCEDSSQVGNAAKMYEALKTISKCDISKEEDCYTLYRVCEAALSAPQRNCDLYKSEPEAYQAYLTAMKNATKKTYVYFEPWLFEKAKGE